MRIVAFGILIAAALTATACDTPAEPKLDAQKDEWVGDPISKPLGETFSFEAVYGNRHIENVVGGAPVAVVSFHEARRQWLGTCYAVGESLVAIDFGDGTGKLVLLRCTEPERIDLFVGVSLDLNNYLNRQIAYIEFLPPGGPIEYRQNAGHYEIRCTDAGSVKYLKLNFEDDTEDKWYWVNCIAPAFPLPMRVGIPVNLDAHFWETGGRIVQGVDVLPPDLAVNVALGENVAVNIGGRTESSLALYASGLLCMKTGTGVLHVYFRSTDVPNHDVYSLTCRAPHDQGGGG